MAANVRWPRQTLQQQGNLGGRQMHQEPHFGSPRGSRRPAFSPQELCPPAPLHPCRRCPARGTRLSHPPALRLGSYFGVRAGGNTARPAAVAAKVLWQRRAGGWAGTAPQLRERRPGCFGLVTCYNGNVRLAVIAVYRRALPPMQAQPRGRCASPEAALGAAAGFASTAFCVIIAIRSRGQECSHGVEPIRC